MIAVGLSFPAGRFHATPWGRHVNEGVPEWPPSPWRLLRALVASWKTKAARLEESRVRRVLEQLAAPPSFYLPEAATGHTRHYMPLHNKPSAKVFDAFVCLEKDSEVAVLWPDAELADGEPDLLVKLLEGLGYLGRAESWCEARLIPANEAAVIAPNCSPLHEDSAQNGQELIRVLCPDPETAFSSEHVVREITTGRDKNKKTVRVSLYDPPWHFCIETGQLDAEKWSDPPGSQWVRYVRPANCLENVAPAPRHVSRSRPKPQVVRFALDSTVLPLVTETLPVAEAARRAAMGIHGRITETDGQRGRSTVFSGKDAENKRLEGHRHAYYLPTDEDGDGRLDHLTIVGRSGLDESEMRALDQIRELKTADREESGHPLRVLLLGWGQLQDYQPLPLARSRTWLSATPYVASRYAKTRGKHRIDLRNPQARAAFLEEDLRNQLCEVHPELAPVRNAIDIEPEWDKQVFHITCKSTGQRFRPIQFKRYRQKRADDGGQRLAGSFRITFPFEVSGPMALGHSAHFGLGLFLPAGEKR